MIRHIVLTKFKPETSEDTIAEIYNGLSQFVSGLEGAENFAGGRSTSPEQIERGYMHGFTVDFDSWDHLQAYTDDPGHKIYSRKLVDHAQGGIDGILVLDLDV